MRILRGREGGKQRGRKGEEEGGTRQEGKRKFTQFIVVYCYNLDFICIVNILMHLIYKLIFS